MLFYYVIVVQLLLVTAKFAVGKVIIKPIITFFTVRHYLLSIF